MAAIASKLPWGLVVSWCLLLNIVLMFDDVRLSILQVPGKIESINVVIDLKALHSAQSQLAAADVAMLAGLDHFPNSHWSASRSS